MDSDVGTSSEGFSEVRARIDAAVADMRGLGVVVIDSVAIPGIDEVNDIFSLNVSATTVSSARSPDSPH